MNLLEARRVTLSVGERTLCTGLDLAVRAGECWGVLGRNGAGKTTLLHALAGLHVPDSGRILLDGQPIRAWRSKARARWLGLLPQDSVDVFPATVTETALIGRHPHLGLWRMESAEDLEQVREALREVGLDAARGRSVDTLSGGERRRLALATLRVQSPRVWLLDEPSNHLDIRHQVRLLSTLRDRALGAGGAVVMSLHDINLAARLCDHLLMMYADDDGSWDASTADTLLTPGRLGRLFGHAMVAVSDGERRVFVPA